MIKSFIRAILLPLLIAANSFGYHQEAIAPQAVLPKEAVIPTAADPSPNSIPNVHCEAISDSVVPEKAAAVISPEDSESPDWEVNPSAYQWPTSVEWNETESTWIYIYEDGSSNDPTRLNESGQDIPAPTSPVTEGISEAAPTVHTHSWQQIEHPETGHSEMYYSCACGCPLPDPSAYDTHVAAYAGTAEMFTIHGHWGSSSQWIVDTPAYSEWYYPECGTTSSAHP